MTTHQPIKYWYKIDFADRLQTMPGDRFTDRMEARLRLDGWTEYETTPSDAIREAHRLTNRPYEE